MFRRQIVSNGGGRSGAFLALDANLELLKKTGQVDIYEYAKTMVNCRQHLIDSVEQYIFIYDVLCEALLCNIEPIPIYKLKQRSSMYRSRKDRELMELQDNHENKLLLMLTSSLRIGDCAGGHRLENRGKNRDVMVVPPDHARPYLQTLHGESKDYTYINAVEVDGFTRKSEFIVTEWPKQQTVDSFWTLIFDHSCHTVVNLTNQSNDKMYPSFIHNKGKKNYGPFTVEILNYQQYSGMTSHMVKIMKRQQQPKPATLSQYCCLRKKQVARRPTLKEFLKDEVKTNTGLPAGQTFRMDQRYWGKIRSASETPKVHAKESMRQMSQAIKEGGQRIVRSASKLAKWAQKGPRAFSQPNSDTLAQFEKVVTPSEPFKADPEKQSRGDVSKLTFMISEIMATGATQQQMEAEIRICCVIQVKMWPLENKVPLSTSSMIELIKMTRAWRKRAPDRPETKPTVVMSHNGVSRCGIFIAANVCVDQMDMDNEVDVFHAVKMIRINRPQLIDMKDEYKYLYDLMLHWYMTNAEYRINEPQDQQELDEDEDEDDLDQYADAVEDTNLSPRRRSTRRSSSRSRPRIDTSQHNNVNNRRSRSMIRREPVYLND
ncbi:unnamed protein product [Bursaphelenchus okinawaensis]|uniref:Tyrosine-protein phosphatase domain-containing protein n=1 Tax=Bursaphelenchus okinawaensis TaxID=465554 RepID=A0A811K8D3_9BILA|nr:unnamed protein product [Bursaphelenchus okinawaensis]CAG9093891.1 unnamed protein product [Bursaphelenchus okinawaensis]